MTYNELVELARTCASNARAASTKEVAAVLWKMALEYCEKAAELDSGPPVNIGNRPPSLAQQ
jgi:hypothetical protein